MGVHDEGIGGGERGIFIAPRGDLTPGRHILYGSGHSHPPRVAGGGWYSPWRRRAVLVECPP